MKSKNNSDIDQEQIELLEYAQSRIKQKKNLYYHFVLFLFISIISLTLNHIFSISNNISFLNYSWSFWLIFSWFFLFLFHVFNFPVEPNWPQGILRRQNGWKQRRKQLGIQT